MPKEVRKGYQPIYRNDFVDPDFPNKFGFHLLVDTDQIYNVLQEFNSIEDERKRLIAFDTETNNLSPEHGSIVGVSFCFDFINSYYIPFRHTVGINADIGCLTWIYELLASATRVCFYNQNFDLRFMRREGYDISKINPDDVSRLVWIWDSRRPPMLSPFLSVLQKAQPTLTLKKKLHYNLMC